MGTNKNKEILDSKTKWITIPIKESIKFLIITPLKKTIVSFNNIFLNKLIFEKSCLFFIFIFLELFHMVGFIDLSEKIITLWGLGILILTMADIGWEDKKIAVKIVYMVGLGIIIISPTIKQEYLDKVSIDSTTITLLSLIMVILSMMLTQMKMKNAQENEQDLLLWIEELSGTRRDSITIFTNLTEYLTTSTEIITNSSEVIASLMDTVLVELADDVDKSKSIEFLKKIKEISKKVEGISKKVRLAQDINDNLMLVIKKAEDTSKKYETIEEYKKYIN